MIRLRTLAAATLAAALVLVLNTSPAHANEPDGFGISLTRVTGTGTAELTWHGSYSCGHDGGILALSAVNLDLLGGPTVNVEPQELVCPAHGTPIHGTIEAAVFPTWGQTARVTAAMTNPTHSAATALVTMTVSNDVSEVVTIDDLTRSTDGTTLTYRGKFSCRVAGATAYLSIQVTQVPHGHLATGTAYATLTCPSPAGTLGNWETTVTSATTPFQPDAIIRNVYVAHPASLSGDDNEGCDEDHDDYDHCDDED